MALCAAQALPVVRASQTPEASQIVWVAKARAEQRVLVEKRSASFARRAVVQVFARLAEHRGRLVSYSLYQRPPPFSRG